MRESEKAGVVVEAVSRYIHDHHNSIGIEETAVLQQFILDGHTRIDSMRADEDVEDETRKAQMSLDEGEDGLDGSDGADGADEELDEDGTDKELPRVSSSRAARIPRLPRASRRKQQQA